ncbi:MAG: DUF4392 domain-containing protein [Acetobacteraceae bacterium]|nr:DUF4392 domain-containing protein [Acetobacteraceae bacterium]
MTNSVSAIDATRTLIDQIEHLIHQDVGRHVQALFAAASGGLWSAAHALAGASRPHIGLITGFYVPLGTPPAAETDGPAATALLVTALTRAGIPCRVLTDDPCREACRAALAGAALQDVPVDTVGVDEPLGGMIAAWRDHGITCAIAIERCGRSAGGPPRNMRGVDISAHTAALDELFSAGPWQTIGIGDGGNEIGMGSLPRPLVAEHVNEGEIIACVTPADHLIMTGVSHWGAYGLIAALALLRPDWMSVLLPCLDPALDRAILRKLVTEGPAVDGVTQRQTLTIDTLGLEAHHAKMRQILAVCRRAGHT